MSKFSFFGVSQTKKDFLESFLTVLFVGEAVIRQNVFSDIVAPKCHPRADMEQ